MPGHPATPIRRQGVPLHLRRRSRQPLRPQPPRKYPPHRLEPIPPGRRKLGQYLKKVAGLVIQLHYPEGTSRDASGADRSNDFLAQQILDAVSQGRSVRVAGNFFASVCTSATAPIRVPSNPPPRWPARANGSSPCLSKPSSAADHAAGLLNALQYLDKLMFRGWLRPERTGLESHHGTRADAAVHTDTGILDSELIDLDLSPHAVNQQLVNPLLVANFGEAARDMASPIDGRTPSTDDSRSDARARSPSRCFRNPIALGLQVAAKIDVANLHPIALIRPFPQKRFEE